MKRSRPDTTLIRLNIGGEMMTTTMNTLVSSVDFFPNSLLAVMFSKSDTIPIDEDGCFFIDADIKIFRHIINVLRRPSLIEYVPPTIGAAQWREELDYWGLARIDTLDETAARIKSLEELSMQELGGVIKKQILQNELTAIKYIFETTGYFKQTGKTRHSTLYIAMDRFALPWGVDLGRYVNEHEAILTAQLKLMLGKCDVTIKPHTKSMRSHNYIFNGESYCSHEVPTMIISMTFIEIV
jgi:hypothetical protein